MIAILSDIHGNYPALLAVFQEIGKYAIDKVISLGDICGYYPFINECIELLKENDVINIVGNHDRYIIDGTECPRSRVANMCLQYQREQITDENLEWLKKSQHKFESEKFLMVHGSFADYEDGYLYKISQSLFTSFNQKIFFAGHTHVQCKASFSNGKTFINPGSVGQPRDGVATAAFALYDEGNNNVALKRVTYDIDRVVFKMIEVGFDKPLASNLYDGTRIGGKIDSIEIEKD